MPTLSRPDVDVLEGLTTAIIVDQERMAANPRSSVGTATDANAMLRILFSRIAEPHIGPPNAYSFNILTALYDDTKPLSGGALKIPTYSMDGWYGRIFAGTGFFDMDKPIRDYTKRE